MKQYDSGLKIWWSYNLERGMDPFKYNIPKVINFLTQNFNMGASYGSLNSIRSSLALLFGPEIGIDPYIKRFFKGVYNLRPVKPRYDRTWNPKIVLDKLSLWYPNDKLDLQRISKKLVTLIALVTAHRVQTISLIKLNNINVFKDRIEVFIDSPIKTSGLGRTQPLLVLPFYFQDNRICPARCLNDYIDKTAHIRSNDNLFISYKSPYSPVCSQTLSKWIKTTLGECGIDTELFSSHSTRHASTSAAIRNGINIELIRKTAGWAQESNTFARFYNRPIVDDRSSFAKVILSKTGK